MSLQKTAILRAIQILESCKASYLVNFDDQQYTNIAKPAKKQNFVDMYREKINSMKPGDIASFTVDRDKAKAMRSAVTAYCSSLWGNQSYVSELKSTTVGLSEVQILRVV